MLEAKNNKINKHHYWREQIKKWQESQLSQSAFCAKSEIKLSTFSYWRKMLSKPEDEKDNKFARVRMVKEQPSHGAPTSIQIKLLSGHIVMMPTEIGFTEIAKLIRLLGLPHD